jgi:hypothetical protein
MTGRTHAGENLAAVLAQREEQRPPPLHMCDGLAQNTPKGQATVACQCTVHARRNFVEIQSDFPEECRKVIDLIAEVYRVEKQIKADGLTAQARLEVHQAQSQPIMEQLKAWLTQQVEDRKVEPNSNLGQAIRHMQDRWQGLTQFLRAPGAPLDNNTERILKRSILHRKNSLFYRTQRGAEGRGSLHELGADRPSQSSQSLRLPAGGGQKHGRRQDRSRPVAAVELSQESSAAQRFVRLTAPTASNPTRQRARRRSLPFRTLTASTPYNMAVDISKERRVRAHGLNDFRGN